VSDLWRERLRTAALAGSAATVVALLQSINLLFRSHDMGGPAAAISFAVWRRLFLLELPVWGSTVMVAPLIAFVCRRFPLLPRPRPTSVIAHLLAAPPICYVAVAITTLFRMPLTTDNPDGYWFTTWQYTRSFSLVFLLPYVTVAAIYSAAVHSRREQRLVLALAQTRLEQLTAQLQPHFLFNALHGVSALMAEDVPRARAMLAQLSDLLRSSLDEDGLEVPLRQELRWLAAYVEVQRCRYPQLEVELAVPPEAQDALVPRFLLQPLVENSVRHALERTGRPLLVEIRATIEQDELRLRVADNGPGFRKLPPLGGIGLTSAEERVRALHGNGRIYLRNRPQGGAEVELVLGARRAEVAPTPTRSAPVVANEMAERPVPVSAV